MTREGEDARRSSELRLGALWLLLFATATIITDPDVFNLGQVLGVHHEPFFVAFVLAAGLALLIATIYHRRAVVREETFDREPRSVFWRVLAAWLVVAVLAALVAEPGVFQPAQLALGITFVVVSGIALIVVTVHGRSSRHREPG